MDAAHRRDCRRKHGSYQSFQTSANDGNNRGVKAIDWEGLLNCVNFKYIAQFHRAPVPEAVGTLHSVLLREQIR